MRIIEATEHAPMSTPSTPVLFSYFSTVDLKKATNNFDASAIIGEGGYGFIYKGLLGDTEVAIKVLRPDGHQGLAEFQREMEALQNLQHPNLVKLVGVCLESCTLVYEYLHGGSLEDRLNCKDNSPPIPWQTRMEIANEICSVLVFLHSNSIIHGDVRPSNILLDESLVCKLSDFGICHLISRTETEDTSFFTQVKGSFFYMDPEFLITGLLSKKSDVYAFGIILLRLLTVRSTTGIAGEVKNALKSDNFKSILDPLAGEWPSAHAEELARLALSCCKKKKRDRPDLAEVWRCLKLIETSCIGSTHDEAPTYFVCPIFQEKWHKYLARKRHDLQLERNEASVQAEPLTEQLTQRVSTPSSPLLYSLFSTSDLKKATDNFDASTIIGEGGYGFVYKGLLGDTEVAIKLLNPGPREFQREIDALSNLHHPNLVTLVGVCLESHALIYKYLHGGNLEDRLNCKDNTPPLHWQTRIRIATELCSVVVFLHSNSIIHCDLKPATVLLDENLLCKLSDFGISHLISRTVENSTEQDTSFFTNPRGTFNYMDPEFLTTGYLSKKSDVYSVGIILLRLLTGKPAFGIANIVTNALESGTLESILDPSAGEWPSIQANELAAIGVLCCEMKKRDRPDLIKVLRLLKLIKASWIGLSTREQFFYVEPPTHFLCPIFQEIMEDPHFAADGFTYEKDAIKGWLESGLDSSPVTSMTLQNTNIVPNRALHSAIQEWLQQNNTQ